MHLIHFGDERPFSPVYVEIGATRVGREGGGPTGRRRKERRERRREEGDKARKGKTKNGEREGEREGEATVSSLSLQATIQATKKAGGYGEGATVRPTHRQRTPKKKERGGGSILQSETPILPPSLFLFWPAEKGGEEEAEEIKSSILFPDLGRRSFGKKRSFASFSSFFFSDCPFTAAFPMIWLATANVLGDSEHGWTFLLLCSFFRGCFGQGKKNPFVMNPDHARELAF